MLLGIATIIALVAAPAPHCTRSEAGPTIMVHPGIELIAIMTWLAGQYPTPPDSRYKSDVWRYFGRYSTHPALAAFRSAPLYPDITETGLWFSDTPALVLTLPDTSSWYTVLGRERVTTMLRGAARFARDTRFYKFHREHQADYTRWARELAADLDRLGGLQAIQDFYGPRGVGDAIPVYLYLEPLNGWGAHSIDSRRLSGVTQDSAVRFTLGPGMPTATPSTPVVFATTSDMLQTIWHEVGHGMIRSWFRRAAVRIDALAGMFDSTDAALRQQNVRTWRAALEENLVRSTVAALLGQQRGDSARSREARRQAARGFALVPRLTDLISEEYLPARARFPTFDLYADRLLTHLEALPLTHP